MAPELKKIGLFVLLLLTTLAAVHGYVQFLLVRCPQGNLAKVNHVMLHHLKADVTVWGASTARVHFDTPAMTEQLNMSCYNVGLDGTPFHQYEGLVREHIDYGHSKVIVLAIDINGLGGRKSLYQGYAWLHYIDNENIYQAIKSIDSELAIKSRFVPLYYLTTYDRRFLGRCMKWVYFGADGEPEITNAGFHPNHVSWQVNQRRPLDRPFRVEVEDQIVAKIKRVIAEAVQNEIKVALVVPPCYAEATAFIENRSEFDSALSSLERENVRVFNYLDHPMCRDKVNFSNNTHLDAGGATLFTSLFIADIKEWMGQK